MEVKNCCFFFNLRKGSLIIGYLNLARSLIDLIFHFLTAYFVASFEYVAEYMAIAEMVIEEQYLPFVFFVLAGLLMINLIYSIVLLIGLHKHKSGFVKAYLIFNIIFMILRVIPLVACIVYKLSFEEIFECLVDLVLCIYFFIVIRSYWLKMDDDASSTPAVDNTANTA